jgi:hypothetical protein
MGKDINKIWNDFLNPEVMRPLLISSSIYLAGFELLKDSIIGRISDFFFAGIGTNGTTIDPRYESEVLSRNSSPLYASLDWLTEMGAIDKSDLNAFENIKVCRNLIAHRLVSFLNGDGLPEDFDKCYKEMVALLHKVELWWITNVEIPINSDLDGKDIDETGIIPGPVLGLQMLYDIALGSEEQSKSFYKKLREQFSNMGA